MQEATTGNGRPAPTAYAAPLLAVESGYTHELRDTRRVELVMPPARSGIPRSPCCMPSIKDPR